MNQAKPTLIILPGWGGNDLLWKFQCEHLRDIVDPKVIVITNQNTTEKMADEVLKRTPEQFILVGHSLGGWVAQWIAIKAPEKVSKLILLGTWTGTATPEFTKFLQTALRRIEQGDSQALLDEVRPSIVHPQRKKDAQLMQLIKASQKQFPTEGLKQQTLAEIQGKITEEFLHKIICPTLIIHARQDTFFSLEEELAIANKIPQAKLTIIEECGHMMQIEQSEAVTALMRLWIAI